MAWKYLQDDYAVLEHRPLLRACLEVERSNPKDNPERFVKLIRKGRTFTVCSDGVHYRARRLPSGMLSNIETLGYCYSHLCPEGQFYAVNDMTVREQHEFRVPMVKVPRGKLLVYNYFEKLADGEISYCYAEHFGNGKNFVYPGEMACGLLLRPDESAFVRGTKTGDPEGNCSYYRIISSTDERVISSSHCLSVQEYYNAKDALHRSMMVEALKDIGPRRMDAEDTIDRFHDFGYPDRSAVVYAINFWKRAAAAHRPKGVWRVFLEGLVHGLPATSGSSQDQQLFDSKDYRLLMERMFASEGPYVTGKEEHILTGLALALDLVKYDRLRAHIFAASS